MKQKPILVVGKSGQLARCLRDRAIENNVPIMHLGRPELDLEDGANIGAAIAALEPAVIINAAAYTAVDRAETESERAFAVNCHAAATIAELAQRRDIPLIHVSTDYVFDGLKDSPYREDDRTAPINIYGSSKLAGEVAVRGACPGAVIIRTAWVYSPYGHNFVRTMQRLSASQSIVRVVDDQRGMPTSALDLAEAILTIAGQMESVNNRDVAGVYHLAGEGEASWYEFAGAIFASLRRRGLKAPELHAIPTAEFPTPARRPKNSCLDLSKAGRAFGVKLPPWQSSLEACLDHMLAPEEAPAC